MLTSYATAELHSKYVAWIEIDHDGRKSVVQVRVLRTVHTDIHPFAYPWVGLTLETYRRIRDGLCPTTPPKILPPELRPANQRRLDEFEKICSELEAQKARDDAAGSSDAADGNADAATAALDVAAEAIVA
eukprot:2415286-Pleurochrysis_carterae.AAC.1